MTAHRRCFVKRLTATLGVVAATTFGATALADGAWPNVGPGLDPGSEHLVPEEPTPLKLREDTAPLQTEGGASDRSVGYGALALLALGGLGVWGLRRLRAANGNVPPPSVNILSRTSLGSRSSVVLLEVEGRKVLVGVTPGGMTALERWRVGEATIVEEAADELAREDLERLEAGDVSTDRAEEESAFHAALGQVERRLARYRANEPEPEPANDTEQDLIATAAPPSAPRRVARTPSINPRPAITGGEQAASLARLRRG